MNDLSKIQQKVIVTLYKSYLDRKTSMSDRDARSFPDLSYIRENYFNDIDIEDLFSICCALNRCGYISCSFYDNTAFFIAISDKTIDYMQHRFYNNAKAVLEFLVSLK